MRKFFTAQSFYLSLFSFCLMGFLGKESSGQSAYCNYQISNLFGYLYDNSQGNNFAITGVSVNGSPALSFTGGTSDAAKPTAGYNQGVFTNFSGTVVAGNSYDWTITMATGANARVINVYVDWNNDFDFVDANEHIISTPSFSGSIPSYTKSFVIPIATNAGSYRMRIICEDLSSAEGPCGGTTGGGFGAQGDAKDFTLSVTPATPCSGTPVGGIVTASVSSVCLGGTSTLNLSGQTTNANGITYQWQQSNIGTPGSFSDISAATNTSYTASALANATGNPLSNYYQCVVTCSFSGLSAISNEDTVTVQPAVTITGTAGSYTINQGSNSALLATGANSYKWTPTTGLSSASVSNPIATPTKSITYTVTGTTSAGCTGKDTVKVNVIIPGSPYCNFQIVNSIFYGYVYDNTMGNNFYITDVSVNGSPSLNFTGGTSDAGIPTDGYNQGTFTSLGASVVQGTDYNWTINMKGGQYARQVRVYVDWNDNNTFTDAGENIITTANIAGSVTTTGAKSYTIPATAAPGAHRMRVVCEYSSEVQRGPCGAAGISGFGDDGAQGDAKDFTLTVIASAPCSGTPNGGTATSSISSVCLNGKAVINLSGQTTGVSGISYQWQQSSTGTAGSFTDISGETNKSYNTPALANVTGSPLSYYYQCVVACSNSGLNSASSTAVVSVEPAVTVTATAASYTINVGSSTTLTATGAATYKWTPSTGLSSALGSSVTAAPGTTTIYTVIGTTSAGCTGKDTAKVNVTQVYSAYCNFQVLNFGGIYGYDNVLGNNFYITGVSVNGSPALNFTGGTSDAGKPSAGYNQGIFTSFSGTVIQAQQYTFSVTRPAGSYGCQIRIYVDWNNDNDYLDAGENILTSANLTASANSFTGNFTIPTNAVTGGGSTVGSHQMRVVCEWSGEPQNGPCGSLGTSAFFDGAQGDAKDFTLNVVAGTPCSGTPVGGTATAVAGSVCLNGKTVINLSGQTTGVSGISYQWQQSLTGTGGSFTDIVGATGQSYPTPTLTNATGSPVNYYYQCVISCSNSGLSSTSTVASVTVQPVVTVVATASSPVINAGSSTTLTASGAVTYKWTPVTGLTDATSLSVTATPGASIIYSVTGTTSAGCTGKDTARVTVIPVYTAYCNFQVLDFFGFIYGYDNIWGNNFIITGLSVNGAPTAINFTGGTSDAGKPGPGYNQGLFTSLNATVRQSLSYTWIVNMSAGSYPRQVRVYVDWNDNNTYTDAGENIITTASIPGSVVTTGALNFTIPPTAPLGTHHMRVICEYQQETQRGPCGLGSENGAQGDAKDFTLIVKDVNGNRNDGQDLISSGQSNNMALNVYPNPSAGNMAVEIYSASADEQMMRIEVVNMLGQVVYTTNAANKNGLTNVQIELPETFSSGIYLVRAGINGKDFVQKLITVSRN